LFSKNMGSEKKEKKKQTSIEYSDFPLFPKARKM
jgi:hypothetical protein